MDVAVVAAITLATNTGISTPALGITRVTDDESSTPFSTRFPVPPTHKALTPVRSVESDGVTAASLRAEKRAVGLEGVKSGMVTYSFPKTADVSTSISLGFIPNRFNTSEIVNDCFDL